MLQMLKQLRERFYRGPDWSDPPDIAEVHGYRSPTIMLCIWLLALLSRVMTPPGIMLGALLAAIAMYSTILPGNTVAILLFALLALYAVDFTTGFIVKPKLLVKRRLPERVRAGAEFEILYSLKNLRGLPAWDITLDPGLPSKALSPAGEEPTAACVPRHGQLSIATRMTALRRGMHTLPRPLVESHFPFNIFKCSCRSGHAQTLIAHPDFKSLESLRMPGGPRLQKMGLAAVSKVGESMEFHGCREFRTGDDPRKMHWLGTARTGEPIVKEFQEERLNRVALVLDTHCRKPGLFKRLVKGISGPDDPLAFEASVSLTAAIAEHLAKGEFIIDLFATGTKTWRFRTGRSLAQLDDLLDILSCVDPSYKEPFEEIDSALLEELNSIGAVIMVLNEADAKAEAFCKRIRESGAGLRALLVSNSPAPEWTEPITPVDIIEGRATHL